MEIGGITIRNDQALGPAITLEALQADYDAVFLGMGLGGVNALGAEGEDQAGCHRCGRFHRELRQASDLAALPVGRDVVVIGGGMTAVDAAVQAKLLGRGKRHHRLSPRPGPHGRQPPSNRTSPPHQACA